MGNGIVEKVTLTADIVLFRLVGDQTEVLLIQRLKDPCKGAYALPGGKMDTTDHTIMDTARREAREEIGVELDADQLEITGIYSASGRDPRQQSTGSRFVSVACTAYVDASITVTSGDDAASARWFSVDRLPALAFDHKTMIEHAYDCAV
jgi:8-oxo-dGTP diphosphatase